MERVNLKTSDNIDIVGDYYAGRGYKGALLLHMMPAGRESWRDFAPKLAKAGCHVLAIDLRGHGESAGGEDGYLDFSDEEHQQSIMDVEAGVSFLQGKGVALEQLVLIGASIGANLSLWHASEKPDIKEMVLLSPGLDYHGIKTEAMMEELEPGQRILFVTSEDDHDNAGQVRTLVGLAPESVSAKLIVYQKAGHGTNMFGKERPDMASEIINWIKE